MPHLFLPTQNHVSRIATCGLKLTFVSCTVKVERGRVARARRPRYSPQDTRAEAGYKSVLPGSGRRYNGPL